MIKFWKVRSITLGKTTKITNRITTRQQLQRTLQLLQFFLKPWHFDNDLTTTGKIFIIAPNCFHFLIKDMSRSRVFAFLLVLLYTYISLSQQINILQSISNFIEPPFKSSSFLHAQTRNILIEIDMRCLNFFLLKLKGVSISSTTLTSEDQVEALY